MKKLQSKRKKTKSPKLRIFATLVFLSLFFFVLGGGLYLGSRYQKHLPNDFFQLGLKGKSPSFFVYEFTDRKNREGEKRELEKGAFTQKQSDYIAYPDIPEDLIHAFIAIEDKRFYRHRGVDWYRTAGAALNYALGFSKQFGASSITQQLIKNMTGKDQITLSRKIQEIFYALDLERSLDKSEILELYLNVIHFSDQCDGITEAAAHYFSKRPQELTLAECASIAAITNSPSYYNPIRNPQNNLARRNLILSEMLDQGYITQEEYDTARGEDLGLNVQDQSEADGGMNSWYVDMVIEDVIADLMKKYDIERAAASRFFYNGGLQIEIAVDEEIQRIVEDYYQNAVHLPHNEKGESAQSSLIVIDPHTGDILGVAGGVGKKRGNRIQNFATQTKRPPGSVLKPITVYAPALEKGLINWASVYDDVPVEFGATGRIPWPKNATGVYRGLTNVSYAVAHSTNTVAVRILEEVGLEEAYFYAKDRFHLSGLTRENGVNDCDVAALALGQLNYGVTLRELTDAYTVFADAGVYHPWRSYYRVLDEDGNILLSNSDKGEIVISSENAAIITKLLQGVIQNGTSSSVTLTSLVECAGKTGTTNQDGDRWFVGYTPDLICGVWCGYEYPEPLVGKNLCTDIWNRVMWELVEEKGGRERFDVPNQVIRATYCKDSGALLSDACLLDPRQNRAEIGWFVKGTEPQKPCKCHVLCLYDSENGGVAHAYCPKDACKEIGLISVRRAFPMQIYVNDAQYVYGGDPLLFEPNENEKQAYFAKERKGYWGISAVLRQYNRSCPIHTKTASDEREWEYLLPKFPLTEDE